MGQQPIAQARAGRVAARREPDLGTAGEGRRVQRRRDGMCPTVALHVHVREIARQNPLESIAGIPVQGLSSGPRCRNLPASRVIRARLAGSRLAAGAHAAAGAPGA
jgi:hypothetical protein